MVTYNFNEKQNEFVDGNNLEVWQSPKYKEAKQKAIELIESEKYKGILSESDFWILMNKTRSGKMGYTGLIISHDGCLKVNDQLEENLKFKPECVSVTRDGYNNSLVFSYMCPEQGLYEVGEVSKENCKNGYPYAMSLKRCMDRVILKNSKIAYAGIYSDSESDEFTQRVEAKEETKAENTKGEETKAENTKGEEPKPQIEGASEKQFVGINKIRAALKMSKDELNERCNAEFGCNTKDINQWQANDLLKELTNELKGKAEK